MLQFTFNKPSFVISESIQETQFILVTIENFDTVIIPQDISIAISAVVDDATSNATQGIVIVTMQHFAIFIFRICSSYFVLIQA